MQVSLSMSRRFIFGSSNLYMSTWAFLSDLSYFPDLALTLMSTRMRGARAHACSYTSCEDSEIKLMAYT